MPDPDTDLPVLTERLLEVIEHDIVPLTREGVQAGNKIFGAALLRKDDFTTFLAETNNEMDNPLWHGEMHLLKRYFEIDASSRPSTRDLIFLTTHEPCSLCLSAITWCGFDNFYYLFSHENSRDSFEIPHDLKILKEVFNVDPGGYNATNAYWQSHSITTLIETLGSDDKQRCQDTLKRIGALYEDLSDTYQAGKQDNDIPLN